MRALACEKIFSATLAFKPTTRFGHLGHNDTIITIGINKQKNYNFEALCGHALLLTLAKAFLMQEHRDCSPLTL